MAPDEAGTRPGAGAASERRTPAIVDVRRNALDDGPGIRTVVFFKGCPLRCTWCQNPEALSPNPEIQRDPSLCTGCRACETACPAARARPAFEAESISECRLCGACVEACPAAARRVAGVRWDPDDLAEHLLRDEVFYRRSGGGVTFSGGEPCLHPEYAGALAARLAARGVHVLVETAGFFDWNRFEAHLLPHLAAVYFDVKLADPERHRRHTGVSNSVILENLARLAARTAPDLLVRTPLVPGITDAEENLAAIARLLKTLALARIALLPYNPLWLPKRRALGLDMPYTHDRWMSADAIARRGDVLREAGIEVV